jgi:hypothetical protein
VKPASKSQFGAVYLHHAWLKRPESSIHGAECMPRPWYDLFLASRCMHVRGRSDAVFFLDHAKKSEAFYFPCSVDLNALKLPHGDMVLRDAREKHASPFSVSVSCYHIVAAIYVL